MQDKYANLISPYWASLKPMNEKEERQIVELKNLLREMREEDIETAEEELLDEENLTDAKEAFKSLSDKDVIRVLTEYIITKL